MKKVPWFLLYVALSYPINYALMANGFANRDYYIRDVERTTREMSLLLSPISLPLRLFGWLAETTMDEPTPEDLEDSRRLYRLLDDSRQMNK